MSLQVMASGKVKMLVKLGKPQDWKTQDMYHVLPCILQTIILFTQVLWVIFTSLQKNVEFIKVLTVEKRGREPYSQMHMLVLSI